MGAQSKARSEAAGAALAAPIGGRLAGRRISAQQFAIAGAAANGIGLLLLGAWTEQTPTILRIAALVVQGVGLGLFQLAYSDIVTANFLSGIAELPAALCC